MIYFFCFATKNNFTSLFSRNWIKVHFPLKDQVIIYYFQIFVEIICRCLSVMHNRKQRSIICKQPCIGSDAFWKIINVNQKQQRTKDGTLRYSRIDIFSCREISQLRTTRCFLSFKKSSKRFSKFPDIPFCVSL